MESSIAVVIGIVVGLAGGFLNSVLKWLEGTEAFSTRKNVSAVILGALAGLGIAIAQALAFAEGITDVQLLILLVTIFLSAAGVSSLAPKAARAASKGAIERTK